MARRNAKEQSGARRFFRSRLFLIILLVFAVLVLFGFVRSYYQDYVIEQQIEALQKEVEQLEKKKLESMGILDYVMSDAFVEEKARTELNMKSPGQNVVIVDHEEAMPRGQVDQEHPQDRQELANPLKWWYYFFDKSKVDQSVYE